MILIKDTDMPITVAEKLVNGTKPCEASPVSKAIAKAICGDDSKACEADMFTVKELKEIADYLIIYYETHKEDDLC